MTTIIKQKPSRGKVAQVHGGRSVCIRLDPLTHSALLHGLDVVSHVLGARASQSTLVRVAVADYIRHLDKTAAKLLEPLPEGAPAGRPQDPTDNSLDATQQRLKSRECSKIKNANAGQTVPYTEQPTYHPGRSFADTLATYRKRKAKRSGLPPITDPVRALMDEEFEREAQRQAPREQTEQNAATTTEGPTAS